MRWASELGVSGRLTMCATTVPPESPVHIDRLRRPSLNRFEEECGSAARGDWARNVAPGGQAPAINVMPAAPAA